MFAVHHVEEDHVVLVVAQVLQRIEKLRAPFAVVHHVAEEHHERAAVRAARDVVQGVHRVRPLVLGGRGSAEQLLQFRHQMPQVDGIAAGLLGDEHVIREDGETHGVALLAEQGDQGRSGIGGELDLVELLRRLF